VLKYTLGTVGGGVLVGQALKYPAVAMSNLTQRQRSAVWGLVSEFASLMNSFKPPALSQPHLVGTFKYAPAAGHIIRTKARAPYSRQGGKSHVKVRDGKVVVKP
jgi:hypothetical protein